MTDVEGAFAHPAPRPAQRRLARRVLRPATSLLAVGTLAATYGILSPQPGGSATVGSLQAQASQLQQQIQSEGMQISALSQKYDEDQNQLAQVEDQIDVTRAKILSDQHSVHVDELHLRSAAIDAYTTDDSVIGVSPLFSGDQKSLSAAQEYGTVATGNLDVAVADLHTAQVTLNNQKLVLDQQQTSAQAAVNAAANARQQASIQQSQLQANLDQVQGQLGALEREAQSIAASEQASITRSRLGTYTNFPPPPPNSAGGRAVAAAESQIGVPYVWGGETPGVGFDCSGLTAWAWGQAGVPLPHYSGAQMADSAPVPVSDLEPGDLLFYGPGGSEHVAMYVGGGEMIEAPYTGASVWITSLRLGDGFVGAGRP